MCSAPTAVILRDTAFARIGDQRRDVFESHRHHIFSVAYYMTADEMEAEQILEATFIDAFRHASQPQPTIDQLDRALMTQLHSRVALDPVPAEPIPMQAAGLKPAPAARRNVRRTDLEEALWQLPALERLCFLLRDVEGYSAERIAPLVAMDAPEIQRALFSARLRMRRLLSSLHPAENPSNS